MKRIYCFVAATFLLLASCNQTETDHSLNIITYNIRFDNPDDGINSWPNRKDNVASLIKFHEADIVCLQEALNHQLIDLEQRLPSFKWIGVGRDDGKEKGEYSPIMFNTTLFELIDWNYFWLSETPEKPSFGWDAACVRICTYAKFRNLSTDQIFYVFNTHFDHIGTQARINSAKLITKQIDEITNGLPVILTGDFNVTPDSEVISTITSHFSDSHSVSKDPPYGPYGTWNGFDYGSPLDQRIDYIFVSKAVEVIKYANISDSRNQKFPSDHLPVYARVLIY